MVKQKVQLQDKISAVEEISIDGFDHIEFYVSNALQACYYYHRGFGFDVVGYRGLETGSRDVTSYALRQNNVQLILSSAVTPQHPIADHVHQHGDGVKTIGLRTRDARKAYETAVSRGAVSLAAPEVYEDEDGTYICASIKTYGDTVHTLV